jgi:putative serine protease PepD
MTPPETHPTATWSIELANGTRVPITRALRVGRLPDCDIVVADGLVSGHHLTVSPDGDAVVVTDTNSTNGTFIGKERLVGSRRLTATTQISVGAAAVTIVRTEDRSKECFLVVQSGPSAGTVAELQPHSSILIGRGEDCGLVINDALASHHHVRVTRHDATDTTELTIEDQGSANGTLINDTPLIARTPTKARIGDLLQVGDSHIVMSESKTPAPRRAETVIRSVPADLRAAAATAATAPTSTTPKRNRRPLVIGSGVAAVVVIGAIVAFMATSGGSGDSGTVQSVVEGQRDKTVQVLTTLSDGAGSGSGVVIDAEKGLVLTNGHVIAGGNTFQIKLHDGKQTVDAKLYSSYPCEDLAVLQISNPSDRSGLANAAIASADQLKVGEQVVALGFPGSAESASSASAFATDQLSATEGIISKTGAKYIDPLSGVAPLPNTIQHTAAINHGNSGGPLFDLNGNLVGINTAMYSDSSGQRMEGVNYAVSAQRINELIDGLTSGKAVGEFGMDLSPAWEKGTDPTVDPPAALEILGVASGSAAAGASIKSGDYVVGVDNVDVTDLVGYCKIVGDGEQHTITTYNTDTERSTDHTLSPRVW